MISPTFPDESVQAQDSSAFRAHAHDRDQPERVAECPGPGDEARNTYILRS